MAGGEKEEEEEEEEEVKEEKEKEEGKEEKEWQEEEEEEKEEGEEETEWQESEEEGEGEDVYDIIRVLRISIRNSPTMTIHIYTFQIHNVCIFQFKYNYLIQAHIYIFLLTLQAGFKPVTSA